MDWPEITKYRAFFLGGNQILCLLSGFYLGKMDFMQVFYFCLHAGHLGKMVMMAINKMPLIVRWLYGKMIMSPIFFICPVC
jgi:hypothetical protein